MPASLLLTPALAEALAGAVRRGVPIETAAGIRGIAPYTVYRWLEIARTGQRHDGATVTGESLGIIGAFGELIAQAEAEWEADKVQAINDAVGVVGKSGVPEWRPALELLKHHPRTRSRWGQVVEQVQSGTIRHEHRIAASLSDDEVMQAYAALNAGDTSDMDPKG